MTTKLAAGVIHNEIRATDQKVTVKRLKVGDEIRWFGGMFDTVTVVSISEEQQYRFYRVDLDSRHSLRHIRHDEVFYLVTDEKEEDHRNCGSREVNRRNIEGLSSMA